MQRIALDELLFAVMKHARLDRVTAEAAAVAACARVFSLLPTIDAACLYQRLPIDIASPAKYGPRTWTWTSEEHDRALVMALAELLDGDMFRRLHRHLPDELRPNVRRGADRHSAAGTSNATSAARPAYSEPMTPISVRPDASASS